MCGYEENFYKTRNCLLFSSRPCIEIDEHFLWLLTEILTFLYFANRFILLSTVCLFCLQTWIRQRIKRSMKGKQNLLIDRYFSESWPHSFTAGFHDDNPACFHDNTLPLTGRMAGLQANHAAAFTGTFVSVLSQSFALEKGNI